MDPSLNNNVTYASFSHQQMEKLFGGSTSKRMNLAEFQQHVSAALSGAQKPLEEAEVRKLFEVNDIDKDGFLDENELQATYERWLRRIVAPLNALVVVDVQNDFVNGSLAVKNSEEIMPVINRLLKEAHFDAVAYTFDKHPPNHISFWTNVDKYPLDASSPIQDPAEAKAFSTVVFSTKFGPTEQRLWPPHCVDGTKGFELFPELYVRPDSFFVYKGMEPDVESYTAFGEPDRGAATCLESTLRQRNITELFIVGLAAEICVAFTGQDALKLGFGVAMVGDGARAVNPDQMPATRAKIEALGGHYTDSEAVIAGRGFSIDDRVTSLRHAIQKA